MGFMKPKKPKVDTATLPAQPTFEDGGRAAEDVARRERAKRGFAAQLLTSGGDAGLGRNLGPVGTRMLLGQGG